MHAHGKSTMLDHIKMRNIGNDMGSTTKKKKRLSAITLRRMNALFTVYIASK